MPPQFGTFKQTLRVQQFDYDFPVVIEKNVEFTRRAGHLIL